MNNQRFTLIFGIYLLMMKELQGSAARANSNPRVVFYEGIL